MVFSLGGGSECSGELCKHTLSAQGTHTAQPPLWSLLCPHPGLGARTLCPEGSRRSWRPPGQRQGTVLRREVGLAAEGARLWKPPGWASAVCPGVSYSTSLSCGGLNTEEEEAALSLGRAPAELPPAVLRAQIGCLGPVESPQVRSCVCLPFPSTDPRPHPRPYHAVLVTA